MYCSPAGPIPYRLRIVKGSAAVKCAEPIGSASDSGRCDGCRDGQGGHRCTGSEPDGMFPPFGGIQCHPEPIGSIGPFLQVGVSPNVVREAAILRFVGLVYIVQHGVRCLVCVVRRELYYVVGSSAIPTSSRSDPSTTCSSRSTCSLSTAPPHLAAAARRRPICSLLRAVP